MTASLYDVAPRLALARDMRLILDPGPRSPRTAELKAAQDGLAGLLAERAGIAA